MTTVLAQRVRKRQRFSQGMGRQSNIGVIGRRTGLQIAKKVDKDVDGFANVDQFFDSDDELEADVRRHSVLAIDFENMSDDEHISPMLRDSVVSPASRKRKSPTPAAKRLSKRVGSYRSSPLAQHNARVSPDSARHSELSPAHSSIADFGASPLSDDTLRWSSQPRQARKPQRKKLGAPQRRPIQDDTDDFALYEQRPAKRSRLTPQRPVLRQRCGLARRDASGRVMRNIPAGHNNVRASSAPLGRPYGQQFDMMQQMQSQLVAPPWHQLAMLAMSMQQYGLPQQAGRQMMGTNSTANNNDIGVHPTTANGNNLEFSDLGDDETVQVASVLTAPSGAVASRALHLQPNASMVIGGRLASHWIFVSAGAVKITCTDMTSGVQLSKRVERAGAHFSIEPGTRAEIKASKLAGAAVNHYAIRASSYES